MAFISGISLSGITMFLSTLQSFMVSTIGWTLIDTGVSGLSENFVVRSSGISGDRIICLKFGASTINESGISVFACKGFNSSTDVADSPTTGSSSLEYSFHLNSGGAIACWFEGDLDHVQMFTSISHSTTLNRYLYAGLPDEIRKVTSAVPNLAIVLTSNGIDSTKSKIVESTPGETNQFITTPIDFTSGDKSDPNMFDGLVYMWPIPVVHSSSDRLFGILKNAYKVGTGVSDMTSLIASNVNYTVIVVPTRVDRLAIRML